MNSSLHEITLECMTNQSYKKSKSIDAITQEDMDKYKERIIQETQQMLNNEITNELKEPFNNYILCLINYFKFIDNQEIINNKYNKQSHGNAPENNILLNYKNKKITLDKFVTKKKLKKINSKKINKLTDKNNINK